MILYMLLGFSVLMLIASGADFWGWWLFGIAGVLWYRLQELEHKVQSLQKQVQVQTLQKQVQVQTLQEQLKSRAAAPPATPVPASVLPSPHPDAFAFDLDFNLDEAPVPLGAQPFPSSVPARAKEIAPTPTPTVPPPALPPEPAVPPTPAPALESWAMPGEPVRVSRPVPTQPRTPASYPPSASETFIEDAFATAKDWLLSGNTVVRVGLVVFFMGLAWLLRYASELYDLPVESRYIGVSIAALVLLALGWWLRLKKPAYALMLQGGGIAVLYLTVFAALRLHALIAPEGAFAVMIVLTAAAVLLAIVQDAMGLACAAILGGLASPILVSTGSGNHVILFSYLALLNAGIALIAWFKAWRVLNLMGFVGTFGIGIAWGLRSYTPEKFATTEPFLILFLLMFVLIGFLFARRKLLTQKDETFPISPWSEANTDYLDGTLAFGPPVLGFGLQCAVIAHIEYGMAFSALALGVLYFALAFCLRGRSEIRLMTEVYLALGNVFCTLAIPLAFDAEWTSAAWALEGAGIYWIGQIQRRPLARGFALLLMVAASFAYLGEVSFATSLDKPLLVGSPTGTVLLGVAYLACYFARRRMETAETGEQPLDFVLGIAGLAFLYLVVPFVFAHYDMIIAWALAGALTVWVGVWLVSRAFFVSALALIGVASLAYLGKISLGVSLDEQLLVGSPTGTALLGGAYLVCYFARRRMETAQTGEQPLDFVLGIAGLAFLYLVAPFVFARYGMITAWALAGALTVFAGVWIASRAFIVSAFVIQLIGGLLLLALADNLLPPLFGDVNYLPLGELRVATFLALAGLVSAWRLHHAASRTVDLDATRALDLDWQKGFSNLFLVWGIGWWVWYVVLSNAIVLPAHGGISFWKTAYVILLLLSLSSALWMVIAYFAKWRSLAFACLLPIPVAALVLAKHGVILHGEGAIIWTEVFLVHFMVLRALRSLLPEITQRAAHVVGVWLGILVLTLATLEAFDYFMPDKWNNAWYCLAWALAPSVYLGLTLLPQLRFWPLSAFAREYRFYAALPMLVLMALWFWNANLFSAGNSFPLRYMPLLNPLELGLLLVLFVCYRWCLRWISEAGEAWRETGREVLLLVGGISVFALATQAVCRVAHAWMGVPFDFSSMLRSMGVQASWSIEWTLMALVLMICGSFRKNRGFWLAGAALIAVVVLKLFLVELSDSGGLARIVSFIGVGILLLIVGYFAPIPPKEGATDGD